MRKMIISAILLLATAACSKQGVEERDRTVRLALSVDGIDVTTRTVEADPYVGAAFSVDAPFKTDVWFTLTPGEYQHDPSANEELSIPVHTQISHTSADGTDAMFEGKNILYPLEEGQDVQEPVYCVGFYPEEKWIQGSEDDNVVTCEITGDHDLMFADLIEGNYNTYFGAQQFKHLLTWVKINVIATSVEAANAWGKVNYLSIEGVNSTVQINLTDEHGTPSQICFTGDPLKMVTVDTDVPAEMKELNIRGTLAGSVLCCPPEPRSETDPTLGYQLTVSTNNVNEKKEIFVPITWENQNDTDSKGKLLIINLYFNEVSVVSGVCTLSYWENTSEDLYLEIEQ